MSTELEAKLKTALDESRLLILGAQVLFGFAFQAVFQDLFKDLSSGAKIIQCVALVMMLISIGALIAPSLCHQIAYHGESRVGAVRVATRFSSVSLFPLIIGLGTSVF